MERMAVISLSTVIGKFASTGLGLLVIFLGLDIRAVAVVGFFSQLLILLILLRALGRDHQIWVKFSISQLVTTFRSSVIFMMGGLLVMLYQQVDIIVISAVAGYETLGWYSSASNIMGTLTFLPTILTTAIFPAIARSHATGSSLLSTVTRKGIEMMLLCGVPVGLGLSAISGPLAVLLFGEQFAPAGPVMATMGIALIFVYQTIILGQSMIATDRLRVWLFIMAGAVVLTVILDVVLVPWTERLFGNGAIGGGLSFIITEVLLTICALYLLPKGIVSWNVFWYAARVFGAGAAMFAAVWLVRDLFIVIPIVTGAFVYISMIAALRVVSPQDRQLLFGAVLSKLGRFIRSSKPQSASL
jgi:O-antigen/teichoic acid export membrane protein